MIAFDHPLRPLAVLQDTEVIWPVLFSAGWAIAVSLLNHVDLIPHWMSWAADKMIRNLGIFTGLLVAFRYNSSVTRWENGSKTITSVHGNLRSLLRILAVSLFASIERDEQTDDNLYGTSQEEVEDHLSLVPAFAVALSQELRGSYFSAHLPPADHSNSTESDFAAHLQRGEHAELAALLPSWYLSRLRRPERLDRSQSVPLQGTDRTERLLKHRRRQLPRQQRQGSATSLRSVSSVGSLDGHANVKDTSNGTAAESDRLLNSEKRLQEQALNIDSTRSLRTRATPRTDDAQQIVITSVALDLLRELQSGLERFHRRGAGTQNTPPVTATLSGPTFAHSIGILNTLSTQMAELERIRDTPIPLVISSFHKSLLYLNSFLVPLMLVSNLGVRAVLPSIIIACVQFSLDHLSRILALPFQDNKHALPLRRGVADLVREWREILARAAR